MYSRSQRRLTGDFRLPEHYSGVAFDRAHPPSPRLPETIADSLPTTAPVPPAPHPMQSLPPPPIPPQEAEKKPSLDTEVYSEGLFGGIGGEELLLLGIIFLLAQRPGEDDTILLLLLLLLRR